MKSLNQYNPYDDEYGVPSLPLFSDQNEEERGHLAMSGNDPPEEVTAYSGSNILEFKPKHLSQKTKIQQTAKVALQVLWRVEGPLAEVEFLELGDLPAQVGFNTFQKLKP